MNRLVLVGNGFDLAHGMKTRYSDFLLDYLKLTFAAAEQQKSFEDEVTKITCPYFQYRPIRGSELNTISDFVSNLLVKEHSLSRGKNVETRTPSQYKWEIGNEFIGNIIRHCSECDWVDIENQYFEHLKYLFAEFAKVREALSINIRELNSGFSWLRDYLEAYLTKQSDPELNSDILKILNGAINKDEIVTVDLTESLKPEQTLILNFNYTDTAERYIKKITKTDRGNFKVNYIHGKLNAIDNPIIFGYGDEIDTTYSKMEEYGENSLFDYIKSFWYFKTSNYHNLIKFIEQTDFQVYIMGHSCGLSDRTMLKMIFEHDNCKSIKIFYHQTVNHNNFIELTQQISKHFTNKGLMREKIVPFERSISLPQSFSRNS